MAASTHWATTAYLSSSGFGLFLLDLDLHHITGVLNDLGNEGLVTPANFSRHPFGQVDKTTIHPVLPEDADSTTERSGVGFDHAEGAVDRPEDKENNEEVVGVPESLEIGPPCFLDRGEDHGHEGKEHDVARPPRSCDELR